MLTETFECMGSIWLLYGNCFPKWLDHFILIPARRVLVAPYPYQHMVLPLFLLFAILMDVGCVSLWWMDFDGSWVCLHVMNGFLLRLSMPHCDRWTLMDGGSCDRWALRDDGCVSLWLMGRLGMSHCDGFSWMLSISYCDGWILMDVDCVSLWWMDSDGC